MRGISRQELIRRQRRDGFVGRQGELAAFTDALNQPTEAAAQFLFHVHGPAGVGKSTLVRRMEAQARERQAITGYVDESVADVVEAMETLSTQFSQQGMALKSFDKALAVYRQRRHEAEAVSGSVSGPEMPTGESDTGSSLPSPSPGSMIASQLGLVGLGMLPGVGAFTGAVDPNQVAAGADRIRAMLSTRFRNHDDLQLVIAPLKVLTPAFLQDLAEVAQRRTWVSLFFDTYERTSPLLDVWLRDILTSERYGDLPANVLVVLAGQTRLDPRTWGDCLDLVAELPLEVFTEAEAQKFLLTKGITNERTVEVILRLSGRLPVLLSTLAEARPVNADDVGDPSGTAVERFLKWEADPARRAVALACAFPQELDEDIYRISVREDAADLFDWLRSLPFITDRAGRCRYHEVVRDSMLRLQRQQSPARWMEQHTRLADAFKERRVQLEEINPTGDRWEIQEWRSLRLQETYHRLCANPRATLPAALRELLDACDHGTATLRRWVQAFMHAGRDADAVEVLKWGQLLVTTLDDDQNPECAALSLLASRAQLSLDGQALAYLLCGRAHRSTGHYEEAIAQYTKSIALDSENGRAYYGRGLTYRLMGRSEEALFDLNRAIQLEPQDGSNLFERGVVYVLKTRYAEALADLNHAIERDPENPWYFTQRGITYRLMERYGEALADLSRAIEIKPDCDSAIAHRGVTYRLMERYDESLADLSRAIEIKPDYDSAIAHRGITYRLMERYDESLADLSRAIEIKPDYDWAIAQRGVTYRLMERYGEALADLNRVIEFDPLASWIAERGVIYRSIERYDEALADLNCAIELDPEDGWKLAQRGVTCRVMERYDEALADLNCAIELDPEDAWKMTERGFVYRLMERYDDALADLNRAIEIKPDYAWAIAQRGVTFRVMERYDEALADLNCAIELDPEDDWKLAQRGVAYRLMERYDEALADLNRAIELEAQEGWIAERSVTYRRMKRYDDALADLNRAIEIKPDHAWSIAQRGITFRSMERYDEALADLNRAIELDPEDDWKLAERGVTYGLMERYDEALADLNRAIELDPDYAWAISQRGTIYRLMERYNEALTDLNQAIELDARAGYIAERGTVYRLMERYDDALADLNRAIELDPDYEWAISQRSFSYRSMERYDDALVDLNRAIELAPQDGWNLYQKGLVLRLMGNPDWRIFSERAVEIFAEDRVGIGHRAMNAKINIFIAHCFMARWNYADQFLERFLSSSPSREALKEALRDLDELTRWVPSSREPTLGFRSRLQNALG
ncbi:ATP-binding protein [Streptomyces griseorubiginosus]|nr:ATP-binding protein [Streptomyces griseorubiginosus]